MGVLMATVPGKSAKQKKSFEKKVGVHDLLVLLDVDGRGGGALRESVKLPLSSSSKQQRGPFLHPRVAQRAPSDIIPAVVCGTRSCVQPILRMVDDLDHHLVVVVDDVGRRAAGRREVSMLLRDRRGVR